MANIRNWTYKGHNWIRTRQLPNTFTISCCTFVLLTDEEYKREKKRVEQNPHPYPKFRRLKETDRELVEFHLGKEDAPEVVKT